MSDLRSPGPSHRLIVALDLDSEGNRALVDRLGDLVSFYKLGAVSLFSGGADLLKALRDRGKDIFLDLKIFDVPNTVRESIRRVADLGVRFATVHGTREIIQAAAEGKGERDLVILAVTALTSLSGRDVQDLYGLPDDVPLEQYVVTKTALMAEAGCDGVIASPEEIGSIRAALAAAGHPKLLIVAPGIRMPGDPTDDQVRIGSPYESIRDGADYLVMGRSIYQAADPRERAREVIAEIERGLADRSTM